MTYFFSHKYRWLPDWLKKAAEKAAQPPEPKKDEVAGREQADPKPPGKPADQREPFVLPLGATVQDLAEKIHRDLAERLLFARVWGGDRQGLRLARDSQLSDRDIVELHFS